jgi:hypothetical protein
MMISEEYRKELHRSLDYNPRTGVFTWKVFRNGRVQAGSIAGHSEEYTCIIFKKKKWKAHRLAWFMHYGVLPEFQIDHINGDRYDNRIENLRDVCQLINTGNKAIHRQGKIRGANITPQGRYQSRTLFNGRNMYLGTFDTPIEAHEAVLGFWENKNVILEGACA